MYVSKIELMYELFGRSDSETVCAECKHFRRMNHHDKTYRKCEVYGITTSESSDWRSGYVACGLFNKDFDGDKPVMGLAHNLDDQIPGQMSIEDIFV